MKARKVLARPTGEEGWRTLTMAHPRSNLGKKPLKIGTEIPEKFLSQRMRKNKTSR
jgi:hypothetical protein